MIPIFRYKKDEKKIVSVTIVLEAKGTRDRKRPTLCFIHGLFKTLYKKITHLKYDFTKDDAEKHTDLNLKIKSCC